MDLPLMPTSIGNGGVRATGWNSTIQILQLWGVWIVLLNKSLLLLLAAAVRQRLFILGRQVVSVVALALCNALKKFHTFCCKVFHHNSASLPELWCCPIYGKCLK